ncbi:MULTISPECIES: glycosyltransferase family 2 protein [unclassified Isoptericola]|uniref:glycosyltransferase family 2 protein n=1 Tax=unclassified Isoptericola TaxID=2623355 RepID=UPI00271339BC|nr:MULTISPECIES: glycosyltransferase family 2 protein [unclassified Isoptericola]MDO8143950.1 glycosyltransferase family 2 protein [Isoptericola sp. 178]MDO8149367.1 glycosyltransferase family 2 protein [Isoptericola sp. b515]
MKLVVQIPCLNEADTLPLVLATLPREVDGFDEVEWLVIDDGSTDGTADVARNLGVDHVLRHTATMGLARSFRDGVDFALAHGADVVVNTDGDNQYPSNRVGDLAAPILAGEADIVVADRQTATIEHFSPFKKRMQRLGSRVVSAAANTSLPDAASGFRAYSRAALLRLNVITQFSYTMETIIQAGNKHLRIVSVPVVTNAKTRESRLFRNIWQHMGRSARAIVRSSIMFRPHLVFLTLAALFFLASAVPAVRFLVFFAQGEGDGHVQSLIFAAAMLVGTLLCLALLVLADLQRTNRILVEDTLERVKNLQYGRDT